LILKVLESISVCDHSVVVVVVVAVDVMPLDGYSNLKLSFIAEG